MQTTPAPTPGQQVSEPRAAWAFALAACCALAVALILVALSFALGNAANLANPLCETPRGRLAEMMASLYAEWLLCAAAIALAGVCALIAQWIAPSSAARVARTARVALVFAALALVGLICSFSWYAMVAAGHCIG
jgi:hypothetical protein